MRQSRKEKKTERDDRENGDSDVSLRNFDTNFSLRLLTDGFRIFCTMKNTQNAACIKSPALSVNVVLIVLLIQHKTNSFYSQNHKTYCSRKFVLMAKDYANR